MKNGKDKPSSGHVLTLALGTSKLTVLHDPQTGAFECTEGEGSVAAARGMLAMAEKKLLEGKSWDVPGVQIECDDGSAVALGLVLMARDFWSLAFNIQCQTNIIAQSQARVAQPNETQRRVFSH